MKKPLVIWRTEHPVHSPAFYGEQIFLRHLFTGKTTQILSGPNIPEEPELSDGAIICVRGYDNLSHVNEFNRYLSKFKWCLVIVTGNENGNDFYKSIKHPNCRIWLQTPRIGNQADYFLGFGWPTDDILKYVPQFSERIAEISFAGQVNNHWRRECVKRLKEIPEAQVLISPGFNQGLKYDDYLNLLHESKFVACPSAISTPDSFRIYEALEMGCVPILDKEGLAEFDYIWDEFPGVAVDKWDHLEVEDLPDFEATQKVCIDWWRNRKEKIVNDLFKQIDEIA